MDPQLERQVRSRFGAVVACLDSARAISDAHFTPSITIKVFSRRDRYICKLGNDK